MNRLKIAATVLLAALLLSTGHAFAWGPEGHAMIAEIAEMRLSDQAKAQVADLLSRDDSNAEHLDEIASWADAVRPARKETAPWHFVDIPLDAPKYDALHDCTNGNCVVAAIKKFSDVLANRNADPKARLEALKFVVHFVGDIHQPLHCVADFSKFPPPQGDKGGNLVQVRNYFDKEKTNLHSLWDGVIIEEALDLQLGDHFQPDLHATLAEAKKLNKKIRDSDASAWAPQGLLGQLDTSLIDWANSSHSLAQDAYRNLPIPQRRGWDETYKEEAWPVIEGQLMRAGVRLAQILNEALQ